ncbi:MAG: hypothetical protein LBT36_03990 [Oscillospiraceae bacterium]|nr:hypothetical protein [Oscillospiraceae bacterium]
MYGANRAHGWLLSEGYGALYALNADGTVSDGVGVTEDSFFREYKIKLEGMYDRFYTARRGARASAPESRRHIRERPCGGSRVLRRR